MGIVFLYIQVPEIRIRDINVLINSQTAYNSKTYKFQTENQSYDLVNDIKNGDLIFEMLRYNQDDRISSYALY